MCLLAKAASQHPLGDAVVIPSVPSSLGCASRQEAEVALHLHTTRRAPMQACNVCKKRVDSRLCTHPAWGGWLAGCAAAPGFCTACFGLEMPATACQLFTRALHTAPNSVAQASDSCSLFGNLVF